jgi:hypothetical protein
MALSKAPPLKPVKTPPMTPPPVSKTQDNFTHHTSPNQGPQPVAPEVVAAGPPRAKTSITKLPPGPKYVTKHGSDS